MNGKAILAILLIVIILVGGSIGAWFVFKDHTPATQEEKLVSLYIEAEDAVTGERVETDFVIVANNTVQITGRTNTKGYEEIKIKESLKLLNVYALNYGGDYYVNQYTYTGNYATLSLYKKGTPNLELIEFSDTDLKLRVNVSEGQYRQLGFCLKWSGNFLDITNTEFTEITPLQRLNGMVDKCYYTLTTLADNITIDLNLNYKLISPLSQYDELGVILFDSDRNYMNQYTIEGENGEDVGSEDVGFTLYTQCVDNKCYFTDSVCNDNYCTF
jgi:hypothetical protein